MTTSSRSVVRPNRYIDSVRLMHVSKRLSDHPGVTDAFVVMATAANVAMARGAGYRSDALAHAGPDDLLACVTAIDPGTAERVLDELDALLDEQPSGERTAATLEEAIAQAPDAGVVAISVPGSFAADLAMDSLDNGLNVFLFSSNVPLEREIELKAQAHRRGLIVMGPDCGTAIVSGAGLGFANGVRRGSIGVIGSSGTGMQSVTSLIHQFGAGISHAIGVGSRDMTDEVGGTSTLDALDALDADPTTEVIVVISKKIGDRVRPRLEQRLSASRKHIIECHLAPGGPTLEETARRAVAVAGVMQSSPIDEGVVPERRSPHPTRRYVRGLFAGGTFCYESQMIALDAGLETRSNAPLLPHMLMADPDLSTGHCLIDMGSEGYTNGRPHPMIDARARCDRLMREGRDPETAVVLFDVVLGFGAAIDPAGDLVRALKEVEQDSDGEIVLLTSVCGTDLDPQGLDGQVKTLEDAGVTVYPSNAAATRAALQAVGVEP